MDSEKADMVFTDPPYGVDYGEKNRFLNSFQKAGKNLKDIANDMLGKDELLDFLTKAFTLAYEQGADHCSYYVTAPQGGELGLMMMMMMMMMSGLPTRHVLIWNKNRQNFSLGRLDYEYKHEPILFTWKKTHKFYGKGQFKSSVWDIDKEQKCDLHPTMKPVALIENALLNSTEAGNIVLDLFGGSGSTLIACEKLNRKCRMMEIDPCYCDVIIERWEKFTGKKVEIKLDTIIKNIGG
jgi:site-specific DNA-methyltransferase (adenine-specific)